MKHYLRLLKRSLARVLGLSHFLWRDALGDEVRFWTRYLSSGGLSWKEEYRDRLDPLLPLQENVRACINPRQGHPIRILDVGAGPLTVLGKVWEGWEIQLSAVDPLAKQYSEVLARQKLTAPVLTEECRAEDLTAKFGSAVFDLAYARNCLDHSENPVLAVEQMLEVVRPGGVVLLEHWPDEGESEDYHGLHQWNFRCENGALIIWNRASRTDMQVRLAGRAHVECSMKSCEGKPMVVAKIRKEPT